MCISHRSVEDHEIHKNSKHRFICFIHLEWNKNRAHLERKKHTVSHISCAVKECCLYLERVEGALH